MDLPDEWGMALCAGLAALLQLAGFAAILTGIRAARVHPNPFSWLIWSIVASLAAASSWRAGATWPLAGAAANALGCFAVLMATLGRGGLHASRADLACLAAALAGIAGWCWTSDPVIGLLLFLAADAVGALPTLRSVARDPWSESVFGWTLLALAGLAAVLSIEPAHWRWSWLGFGHWGGAVYVAAINALVAVAIVGSRAARTSLHLARPSGPRERRPVQA